MKRKTFKMAVMLLGMFFSSEAFTQPNVSLMAHPYFDLDYAFFQSVYPGQTNLELYLEISNQELLFVRTDRGYVANFEVAVYIYNDKGKLAADQFHRRQVSAQNYESTKAATITSVLQFDFNLPPNNYTVVTEITDRESQKSTSRDLSVDIPSFATEELAISSIELCRKIEYRSGSTKTISGFQKNGRIAIPRPKRAVSANEQILGVYFELYNFKHEITAKKNSFRMQYQIKNSSGEIKLSKAFRLAKPDMTAAAISFNFDVSSLPSGDHTLLISVLDEDTGKSVQQSATFFHWSNGPKMNWETVAANIDMLKYIATPSELKQLKNTPPEELEDALRAFWEAKDPTPGTEENEAMTDYYRRLAMANQCFSRNNVPGWKTDQGKTLIRFGNPDLIRKSNYSQKKYAYEIWEYSRLNLRFVFVDEYGFGDYRLWQPTALSILKAKSER